MIKDPRDLRGDLRQYPRPGTITLRPYRERRLTHRGRLIVGLLWLALIAGILAVAVYIAPDVAGGLP